ncbi:MAG: ATP-dependent sacrificial sulfur transferase LarE [Polyangia bacterium]
MGDEKLVSLRGVLERLDSVAVALSGGVDSALLLRACREWVPGRVLAATAASRLHPFSDLAVAVGRALDVEVRFLRAEPLDDERFRRNPRDRCLICKRMIMGALVELAREEGIEAALEGSVTDDLEEHRPGRRALEELGVRSPLVEVGLSKAEVRLVAQSWSIPVSERPPDTCLATRFPRGEELTDSALRRVARAEEYLRGLVSGPLRVRAHGRTARIEVDAEQIERLVQPGVRREVGERLESIGFSHVAVDLAGYRSGSMD